METGLTRSHKLKIAMICPEYPPKTGPGPTRMTAFVKGLAERGYEPRVFTSKKVPGSFAVRWCKINDPLRPSAGAAGTIGGRGRVQSVFEKFVNLWIPMEPIYTLSLPGLCRVFAAFIKHERPDLIFATSHPLAGAVGGALLKRRHSLPLVVEFRDPWTQNPVRNWPTPVHFAVESFLERWVLRAADAVIMNTPTARSNLLAKYGWLNSDRVHVISHGYNGPMAQHTGKCGQAHEVGNPGHVKLAYLGGFYTPWKSAEGGRIRGLVRSFSGTVKSAMSYNIKKSFEQERGSSPATILRAIAAHNANAQGSMPRITIDFIGGEPRQLLHHISARDLEEGVVRICPRAAVDDIRRVLQHYDLLYLTNPPIPGSPFIGAKTFDYLAAGRPIIAELVDGDQARLVTNAKAGWLCPPGSHEAIGAAFREALADSCSKIRNFQPDWNYIDLFARRHQVDDLVKVIEQAVGRCPRRTVISEGYLKMNDCLKTEVT